MIRDLALILSVILSGAAFGIALSARASADRAYIEGVNATPQPKKESPPEEGGRAGDNSGALREFWI